jgi:hypothetical protein
MTEPLVTYRGAPRLRIGRLGMAGVDRHIEYKRELFA